MKEKQGRRPPQPSGASPVKRARVEKGDGDLIGKLPDDILRTIISLLPIKDGVRTQAFARRWKDLWRSAPLNLDAVHLCTNEFNRSSIVYKILSDHHGPGRRFNFPRICLHEDSKKIAEDAARVESWFHSRALTNLQELQIGFKLIYENYSLKLFQLPSSVFRCASTLVSARFWSCNFPKEISPSLSFPLIKQLTLHGVSICADIFHGVLSACHVLESLNLFNIYCVGYLRIISPTLRSIVLGSCYSGKRELVIEETPLLERLLLSALDYDDKTIRLIRAPKLKILGPLSPWVSEIDISSLVFQRLIPTSLNDLLCTVKVLALQFSHASVETSTSLR